MIPCSRCEREPAIGAIEMLGAIFPHCHGCLIAVLMAEAQFPVYTITK